MVKISDLVRVHDGDSTARSLADNLGDGFLCTRNTFFAAVRNLAVGAGLRFSREISDHWLQYQALSFFSLQDIFDKREVPYKDNVTVFRSLLRQSPEFSLPPVLILNSLKRNPLLHEAAHFVAFQMLLEHRNDEAAPKASQPWFVCYNLLSEAFARVSERFALFSANTDMHVLLVSLNVLCPYDVAQKQAFDCAVAKLGMQQPFHLAMLVSLFANVSGEPLQPTLSKRFIDLSFAAFGAEYRIEQGLHSFVKAFASMKQGFREYTTRAYFRLFGCEREFDTALKELILDTSRLSWVCHLFFLMVERLFAAIEEPECGNQGGPSHVSGVLT